MVSHAFHSARMQPILAELAETLEGISWAPATVPIVSTLTGDVAEAHQLGSPEYWVRQARSTVRFAEAVQVLRDRGVRTLVEVGPDGALSALAADCLGDGAGVGAVPVLRPGREEPASVLAAVARVYVDGGSVDWGAVFAGSGAVRVPLPTYAFQRRRYWLPAGDEAGAGGSGAAAPVDAQFWGAVERGDVAEVASVLGLAADGGVEGDGSLGRLLPALSSWRRRRGEELTVEGWRYQDRWVRVTGEGGAGGWLLVVPAGEVELEWVPRVRERLGRRLVQVEVGVGDGREVVAGVVGRAVADAVAAGVQVSVVVSLLGLAEGAGQVGVPVGLLSTGVLVQALGDAQVSARLWLVTQGAVSVGRSDVVGSPVQAGLWGLGRVAGLEHPDRWGGLVDLPPVVDEEAVGRLVGVVGGGEGEVAVRPAGVWGRRLVPAAALGMQGGSGWQPRGTVLVTGGTGVLGGHVARWLARGGASHVMLASRRGPAAVGAAELAAELRGYGAEVTVAACDMADRHAAGQLLAEVVAAGPLSAVFHTAGVLDDGVLDGLTAQRWARVWRAKVDTALALDELTRDLGLSAFVLFSSVAGTLGSAGQGSYAAANAVLDALARRRAAVGLAATSVAWGPWGGGGMVNEAVEARLRTRGFTPMPPQLAVAALGGAAQRGETAMMVAAVDWDRLVSATAGAGVGHLLDLLPQARQALEKQHAGSAESQLVTRLAGLSREEGYRLLLDLVRGQAAEVLGYPNKEPVVVDRAFRELGFDSLTAVELRNRLGTVTGLQLATTLVFDYPTAAALAGHLCDELVPDTAVRPAAGGAVAAQTGDPIVVVGMGCRFPGGVGSPEQLWDLVASGADGVSGFPTNRGWDVEVDPSGERIGASVVGQGGFLYGADEFDAELFGVSPREALAMDPQQRLLLEVSWEVFERTGVDPLSLRGQRVGVFVGTNGQDYAELLRSADMAVVGGYLSTGNAGSVLSGRVSYTFGLEGPAVTVDTACSSSLVALHLAAQALRGGECDLALAGGVTVMATPGAFVEFSRQGGLAPDGRCKSFAAAADGTSWAEGIGLLLVERLSDAQRNGHEVLAVVRGSAVNQDGASNGLTAPNGPSQQRVITQALAAAGLSAGDVDAVEGHGTGTRLGDPIEAQALLAAYGQGRSVDRPLWLGSVKSNIGHTQAAAGVAGVIKMMLAMRHGVLPATLHVDEPTPHVDWSAGGVRLLTEPVPWPQNGRPRRAGVSSFGISGTNAHVIVEAPQAGADIAGAARQSAGGQGTQGQGVGGVGPRLVGSGVVPWVPWVVSAGSAAGLREQADRLREFVEAGNRLVAAGDGVDVVDVGWSLVSSRASLPHRAVVLGSGAGQLMAELGALAQGMGSGLVMSGTAGGGGVGMMFAGQGSQRVGMGAGLYRAFPVFAAAFDEVCGHLDQWLPQPLGEVVFAGPGQAEPEQAEPGQARLVGELGPVDVDREPAAMGLLDQTAFAQAALFAVEVALFRLVESWGVRADFVMGHSVGEVAAAHAAGVLSLADACVLVGQRGRLMQALPAGGAMVAVRAGAAEVQADLSPYAGRLEIAAVNSPTSTVVSGDADAVEEYTAWCRQAGRKTTRLVVSHAFHSVRMQPMLDELAEALKGVSWAPAALPMVSTLTGGVVEPHQLGSPEYWVRQARSTVRFADAVRVLQGRGVRTLVEIGPDGALSALAADCLGDGTGTNVVPVLRPGRQEPLSVLTAVAQVYVDGGPVDWAAVFAGTGAVRVPLPTYAFQRRRYWLPAGPGGDVPSSGLVATGRTNDDTPVVRQRLAESSPAEREDLLRDVVRADVAAVLGYQVDEIAPDRVLAELGLSSISAAELGARLSRATGIRVSTAAVLEHATVAALARELAVGVDHPAPSESPLVALFRQACADGKVEEGVDLLAAAAFLRTSSDDPGVGEPVRFTEGATRPVLICLPSLVAPATAMQYARFAAAFRGVRKVSAVVPPGYEATEDLPGCLAAAIRAQVPAVQQCAGQSPFVLVGYSSGGWLAHALVDELASSGRPPSGVVLLDTYLPGDREMAELMPTLFRELAARQDFAGLTSDAKLTAMGRYLRLFREWAPSASTVPTLFVRASDALVRLTSAQRTPWPLPHMEVEVAGDHLSMIEEHATTTARAVDDWLTTLS
ncbi:MAG TPA: SDR family NAD(P)-dependent oxidoreductase [Micromonosporaceae bacterium]|nr:SDR family NAD(P)-dependent oxidoreductase [Micromonosporaceae bacterium]